MNCDAVQLRLLARHLSFGGYIRRFVREAIDEFTFVFDCQAD